MRHILFISLTLLASAMPASADQPTNTPPSTARFGAQRPSQNPYAKLFEARDALQQAVQQELNKLGAPKSKIICGMTVIEAHPGIDPKQGVTPPKDEKTRFTIRAVNPPICNSSAPR